MASAKKGGTWYELVRVAVSPSVEMSKLKRSSLTASLNVATAAGSNRELFIGQ